MHAISQTSVGRKKIVDCKSHGLFFTLITVSLVLAIVESTSTIQMGRSYYGLVLKFSIYQLDYHTWTILWLLLTAGCS